ncbi:hypothetical protein SBF1_600001 [Candidatus Desulfosporosinus infrequens]|uniref:Uncharacterized protein n=1 Tax=Candidatus Desulfosporosinus infrequens TaxID=2043169 RepID=A0A2U3LLF1_9FIRM|nr:hypothetical protein SBF1_600001 [Candidatus Desulfosporosinus infrequens]
MLRDEIREQKRTGNGVHSRALRLRKHEAVRTPSESLKGFEKRNVISPGVLHVTTIGEMEMNALIEKIKTGEIPSRAEFDALDFIGSQTAAAEMRRLHTNAEICNSWKCSATSLSSFFAKMQVAKSKGNNVMVGQSAVDFRDKIRATRGVPKIGEPKEKRAYDKAPVPVPTTIPNEETVYTYAITPAPIPPKEPENVLTNIKRKFKTEELAKFLERLALYLSEDDQEFWVEIKVTEN